MGSTANESFGNLEKSRNYRSFGRRYASLVLPDPTRGTDTIVAIDEHLQPSVSKALEVVEERMKDVSRRQGDVDEDEGSRERGAEENV